MRAADFDYVRAGDLGHALEVLASEGPDAKVMAGGQSLVPILMMRLARPRLVVDIGRLAELRYVDPEPGVLRIGATVTHAQLEYGRLGEEARRALPVIEAAAGLIAHHPIRTRGTFCGSISHADPAAEWCLLARLLDGQVVATSRRGSREIPVEQFFRGFLTNDLHDDELVSEVNLPLGPTGVRIVEVTRRHGDFPIVAAGVGLSMRDGRCTDVRLGLGGVSEVPLRLGQLERELEGRAPTPAVIDEVAAAAGDLVEPPSDIHGTTAYRRQLVKVLTGRALNDAVAMAAGSGRDE